MTDTTFTPEPNKIERERLVMEFEENFPNGRPMNSDEYRALLILINYVGPLLRAKDFPSEVSDAWHFLVWEMDA